MLRSSTGLIVLLGLSLSACSGKKDKRPQIFFGECRLAVESKVKGAEILVDGIPAGHDNVEVQIPCGEKQIRVEKHGYLPYEDYHSVSVGQVLKVEVKLDKLRRTPDYALSSELIDQVRRGRKLHDPWLEPGMADEAEVDAEAPKVAAATPTSGAAAAPAAGGAFSTNVDDWR